eukprot:2135978-Prymnesium_polylepis.1
MSPARVRLPLKLWGAIGRGSQPADETRGRSQFQLLVMREGGARTRHARDQVESMERAVTSRP